MSTIAEDKGSSMEDGKCWYELDEEHMQALIEEDGGDGEGFRRCRHDRRLEIVSLDQSSERALSLPRSRPSY